MKHLLLVMASVVSMGLMTLGFMWLFGGTRQDAQLATLTGVVANLVVHVYAKEDP